MSSVMVPDSRCFARWGPMPRATTRCYEIIDGQRVEMPPMKRVRRHLAARLVEQADRPHSSADPQARESSSGVPVPTALYRQQRTRNRRPDIAFVSFERCPRITHCPPRGRMPGVSFPIWRSR